KVDLFFRELLERRFGYAEVLGQEWFGRVADPVGDAEGAELGEVAVVEDENKVTGLVAKTLQHVAVAAGKVPDVAGIKVVGLRIARRTDARCSPPPLGDEGPLCRGGVPMKLSHRSWLKPHRDSRDPLGNRQLLHGRLFPVALADDLALRL